LQAPRCPMAPFAGPAGFFWLSNPVEVRAEMRFVRPPITNSPGAPTLPAPSLSFPDPLFTSGGGGTLRRYARPRPAFYQDVVDVHFDGTRFDT
jgi:hypothetical protein